MNTVITKRATITLESPWYRCENGNEFRCSGQPRRCPVCASTKIEMIVDIADELKPNNQTDAARPE